MIGYRSHLKKNARLLRKNMTDSERALWRHLRGKQLLGVQFYRQKPIGKYIVYFYAPQVKLAIEVDGSQHLSASQMEIDKRRDRFLHCQGIHVLRFDSREVLVNTGGTLEVIHQVMMGRIKG
jgi:very-short-patch-repair endonuclease